MTGRVLRWLGTPVKPGPAAGVLRREAQEPALPHSDVCEMARVQGHSPQRVLQVRKQRPWPDTGTGHVPPVRPGRPPQRTCKHLLRSRRRPGGMRESPPVLHSAGQQAAILALKGKQRGCKLMCVPHGSPGAHTLATAVASAERNREPGRGCHLCPA